MNLLAVISWCFLFSYAAGYSLSISDIRLVNGTGPYGGRVEIQINGTWGTVCDDSFDINDATVMCRMMNLKASTYLTGARYGQGTGPTFTQFQCLGHELHFKDCPYVSNVQCTHARDIGIICSECSGISISNGYGVDISADGTVLSAMCKNDFSSNATSKCNKGTWSPPSINCKDDIIEIRLVNGTGLYDGRVELLVNGTWGTICSTSFSSREATVICKTLFGTNNYLKYETSSSNYGPGTGPIHIYNLGCKGFETYINECSYSVDVSCTDHSRDAAVACNVQHLNITATRLVNGTGPYDGRIEFYVDGHWGTICNRYIDVFDAQTICSTHNTSLALHFTKPVYGKGTGPVLIEDIFCLRHHDHVNECTFYSPYKPYCAHDYDLSIVCTPCGLPRIHNGEAFSFNDTELTVKCQEGFFPDFIKMQCTDNGTWVESQRCTLYDDGYNLSISDIRLVNGTGPYGGRVEIQMNGIWGTVCDDLFDINDATVMCRMMNLKASTYLTGARYGQGTGPTFTQFQCLGHELHFKDCPYVSNVQCTHARDIGIICSECSGISISNGYGVDISADGTVLSAMCKNGFSSNTTSKCNKGTWSPPSIICKHDIIEIRLVNGTGLYDGRVELLVNGTWGTICSTAFSSREAKVICRTLFGTNNYLTYETTSSPYGPGTGPIHIDNLGCTGSETDINECSYSVDVSCTDHSRDAAVACNVQNLNITATRLVNGTGPYDGRIEFYVDGHWGTICNRYIDVFDAQTICSTHNASLALHFTKNMYGKGTGPVLINDIYCYKHRDHVKECTFSSPYRRHCAHDYDLSIVCTPCGLPRIHNGEAFSFNNTELTVKCQEGFFPDYIKMQCTDNGTWVEIQKCTSYNAYPLDISEVRLSNRHHFSHEGRVELLVNGTWGTVCDTNFDSADAAVLCRMLDLEYKKFYKNAGHFGKGSGTIFVDDLHCNGTEKHINNCTYSISNYCTHGNDVGVACTGYQLNITDIRLAGTNGPYHGRVEIKADGVWGTVCDNYLDGARVVCRMLGLGYNIHYSNAKYGPGSGPIYLDRLYCSYSATHINECKYGVNKYYKCDHGDDASVVCFGPRLNITGARLVNGTGPFDGRAEIKVNDTWGTICDENFDMLDADYFCKKLGLRAVKFYTGAFYGKGSGPVFIDQLFCKKYDSDLSDCKYLFLNACTHERDVAVVCNECGQTEISHWDPRYLSYNGTTLYADCSHYKTLHGTLKLTCNSVTRTWQTEGRCQEYNYPLNITDIRLADGPGPSQGRVEIKYLNTWGTICDDYFGISEANLICRMVGYTRALSFLTRAFYGEGKGPIYADDLDCKENALDLNDCFYKTYDDCTHGDDISVVCTDCEQTDISSWDDRYLTYNGSTVYADCSYRKPYLGTLKLTCNRDTKTWITEGQCQIYSYPLSVTDIRLVDGPSPEKGRVEIKSLNTWGTICDDSFGISEANLICRMVGYASARKFYKHAFYGMGKGPIFADNLNCTENAFDLNDCNYTTYDDCTHGKDISVVCRGCRDATPRNGFVNTSSAGFLTAVYVTCEKGYKLIGEEIIICQPDGTWSNQPVCKLIDCGDPTPEHGSSNSSVSTNGTVVRIECQTGYTLIGESIITCQTNETWTGTPSCVIKDCGDVSPNHGLVNTSSTTYLTVVHVTCEKDYKLIGEETTICQANAFWSNRPVCKHIEKAVGYDTKVTIILACCTGILVVAIIGLVAVIAFRMRNSISRTVQKDTMKAGTKAENDHSNDELTEFTDIQKATTEGGSETRL